jgi:hypothetical protein
MERSRSWLSLSKLQSQTEEKSFYFREPAVDPLQSLKNFDSTPPAGERLSVFSVSFAPNRKKAGKGLEKRNRRKNIFFRLNSPNFISSRAQLTLPSAEMLIYIYSKSSFLDERARKLLPFSLLGPLSSWGLLRLRLSYLLAFN